MRLGRHIGMIGILQTAFWPVAAAAVPVLTFESRGMKLQRELVESQVGPIWAMTFLPDGNLLMTIKSGAIKKYDVKKKSSTNVTGTPPVAVFGQGGLLDIVLSPSFKKDQKIYLSYSKQVGPNLYTTALGVGRFDGKALLGFREIFVAQGSSTKGEHFAGRIVLDGPSIWFSVGERGERDNAQILTNHLGKILRLTLEGKAYPDNPFVGRKDALPEIYSYGHRNPQGLVKHPITGEIWAHEHGPRGGDEINIIKKGLNYGWPKATFGKEYWGPTIGRSLVEGTEPPIHQWTPSIAPCGMIIYNGNALPGWKGLVIAGALAKTHLNLTELRNNQMVAEERLFAKETLRVREVEQGPDGEIWYATDDGSLFRIRKI
ncbi:MAG TPA: PQQ-dependent sugar dehydrogenase [Oligoflexus sp.]|uniref:PQQ-dependent sugar dehydrogenase n=1 Tax=Oligoflexus sp. TaxID=1971216 RepID=UPI002D22E72B|nr:PQQ-dependent sugar dehydrogenase [Oligoflexus sp.]HYX38014.1 PQQ-dependent sugar dehydrogenase [Oligoflexus sp.]